jgi:hypothetical protein
MKRSFFGFPPQVPDARFSRFVNLGRDHTSVMHGEDNEPTGLHVSVRGTSVADLPGNMGNLIAPHAFANCERCTFHYRVLQKCEKRQRILLSEHYRHQK